MHLSVVILLISVSLCHSFYSVTLRCPSLKLKMREMKEGNKESSLAPPSTGSGNELSPMKVAYGATWLALTTYAFGFSPGGSTEAAAQDSELIAKMVSTFNAVKSSFSADLRSSSCNSPAFKKCSAQA